MYSLTVLKVRSQKPVSLGSNQGVNKTVPSGGSRGEPSPLPFPASNGTCIPWLISSLPFLLCLHYCLALSSVVTIHSASLLWKHFWLHLGLPWIIQDNHPTSRSLTWSHLQSPCGPTRYHLQVPESRTWVSLEALIQPITFLHSFSQQVFTEHQAPC